MSRIHELTTALFLAILLVPTHPASSQDAFDDLELRAIGPAVMGGRIDALAVVTSQPGTVFVGTASGGLWRTTNMGTTWTPVFDDYETSSIGDVAVAASDPAMVWVGTGEPNNRQSSTLGNGVYKSEDGGERFTHVGLEATGHIGKVLIDPSRPSRVFVAALGNLWKANEERGVFRTLDAGRTWDKVLFVDADTGATTMAMDPINSDILYAATYQRRRTPWGFSGGGPGSGIHKSTDGGDTGSRLEHGLPDGPLGRIGLAVAPNAPRTVYALVEHTSEGGVYRSFDRGEHWEKVNSLNPRPMYYSKIFVDPSDAERVYVLGSSFHSSANGGRDFETHTEMTPTYDIGVHGDHHALWIDPSNGSHLVLGGDGGLYFSWDRARSFRKIDNLPLGQFYAVAVDLDRPYNIYGGAQDTHSWTGPSATRHQIGILNGDWVQTNFGDGMYQQADPEDPTIAYTESQGGNLVRLDRRTGDRKVIKPTPEEEGQRLRFHWTAPFAISRHDPESLYFGGNRLFVTRDRGESWTSSPDLTWSEDRDELPIMGSVPGENTLSRHDGVAAWGTISTISESPMTRGTVYVGTDDGRIQVTRDDGETWESVEDALSDFEPRRAKVSRVVASHHAAGRAYVSFDRHHLGDPSPYVFVTEDFGGSFRALTLPASAWWVNVVAEHPANGDLLFAGAETGLFLSFDRGESWQVVKGGLPTVPVDDLVIHPRDDDLIVATHGRSIYILDDLSPLAAFRGADTSLQLFTPRDAMVFLPWKHESYGGQAQFIGDNPTYGALVTYYLPSDTSDDAVTLVVKDSGGAVLRDLSAPGGKGFHRVSWDLRTKPVELSSPARGPIVPVGDYVLELTVSGETRTAPLSVRMDERLDINAAESRERYDFLVEANELRSKLNDAVQDTENLIADAAKLQALFSGEASGELVDALEGLDEALGEAARPIGGGRPSFRNPTLLTRVSRLTSELSGSEVTQGSLHGPTAAQRRQLGLLTARADEALAALEDVTRRSLAEVNRLLGERGPLRLGGAE